MRKIVSFILLLIIKIYQNVISPLFPPKCRFSPTCSEYGKQAIIKHGPLTGCWLSIKRIFKCHPWGGNGEDLVP
jgi:hypothetical protein